MTGFARDVYSMVGVGEIRLRERNGKETPSLCEVEERYRSEDNVRNEQSSQSERAEIVFPLPMANDSSVVANHISQLA